MSMLLGGLLTVCLSILSWPCAVHAAVIVADSAEDICPADADPCVIEDRVRIPANSTLDFGLRAVRIEDGGLLSVREGAVLSLGSLTATGTARTVIKLGRDVSLYIRAYRTCEGTMQVCLRDAECASERCSEGDGSIDIGGYLDARANGGFGTSIDIDAAGPVRMTGGMGLGGGAFGGTLWIGSNARVTIEDRSISCRNGALFEVHGKEEVTISSDILCPSARSPAEVVVSSNADLTITGSINVSSRGGDGGGGFIEFTADGDLRIGDPDAVKEQYLRADGSMGAVGQGIDYGGDLDFAAKGNVNVAPNVRILARSSRPGREGGTLFLIGDTGVQFHGQAELRGSDAFATIESPESLLFSGTAAIRMSTTGSAGIVALYGGDVILAGRLSTEGGLASPSYSPIFIGGCAVTVLDGAWVENSAQDGANEIASIGPALVTTGASFSASAGPNLVRYRDQSQPPQLDGTFTPAALVSHDPTLPPCSP